MQPSKLRLLFQQTKLERLSLSRWPGYRGQVKGKLQAQRSRRKRLDRRWKYRNRQIFRKLNFDRPQWLERVRRRL
jgi:hypothetical protein